MKHTPDSCKQQLQTPKIPHVGGKKHGWASGPIHHDNKSNYRLAKTLHAHCIPTNPAMTVNTLACKDIQTVAKNLSFYAKNIFFTLSPYQVGIGTH